MVCNYIGTHGWWPVWSLCTITQCDEMPVAKSVTHNATGLAGGIMRGERVNTRIAQGGNHWTGTHATIAGASWCRGQLLQGPAGAGRPAGAGASCGAGFAGAGASALPVRSFTATPKSAFCVSFRRAPPPPPTSGARSTYDPTGKIKKSHSPLTGVTLALASTCDREDTVK